MLFQCNGIKLGQRRGTNAAAQTTDDAFKRDDVALVDLQSQKRKEVLYFSAFIETDTAK